MVEGTATINTKSADASRIRCILKPPDCMIKADHYYHTVERAVNSGSPRKNIATCKRPEQTCPHPANEHLAHRPNRTGVEPAFIHSCLKSTMRDHAKAPPRR